MYIYIYTSFFVHCLIFLYFSNDVEIESFTLLKKTPEEAGARAACLQSGGPGPGTEAGSWILGRPCLGCIPISVI